jgi:hypothetical protein
MLRFHDIDICLVNAPEITLMEHVLTRTNIMPVTANGPVLACVRVAAKGMT